MKKYIFLAMVLLKTPMAFSFCKAEGLQRDIEVITARSDLSIDQRRKDIAYAKSAFKEDIIECAVAGEAISYKAAYLAVNYIRADDTTIQGRAMEDLIKKINSRIPNN
jgi:hypothetical protein